MQSKRSSLIFIAKTSTLGSLIYMLTLPEKGYLFMETQQINLHSKSIFVSFLKYCLWIVKSLSTKAAISHKRTCTAKTSMTTYRNKGQVELLSSKPQKTLSAGLYNAIITQVESSILWFPLDRKKKLSLSPRKRH